jgi:uracil-DNA glycosylase
MRRRSRFASGWTRAHLQRDVTQPGFYRRFFGIICANLESPTNMLKKRKPEDAADSHKFGQAIVPKTDDVAELRIAAAKCRACPLYRNATQTVFGEGELDAEVMFVGEQPGDQEDVAGSPFVGPAGGILDRALAAARIDRRKCYVTNAVKHFKWKPAGKRRIHERPNAREIEACRPWLEAEILAMNPAILVCLGATAVRSVFGRGLPVMKNRGRLISSPFCPKTLVTVHPSSVLRAPDPEIQKKAYADFVADLVKAAEYLHSLFPGT